MTASALSWPKLRLSAGQLLAILVILIAGIIVAFLIWLWFVGIPAGNRADALSRAKDRQETAAMMAAIHHQGFAGVKASDIIYDETDGTSFFEYAAGSCSLPIYLIGSAAQTATYMVLKNVDYGTILVTAGKLRKLPDTKACFIK